MTTKEGYNTLFQINDGKVFDISGSVPVEMPLSASQMIERANKTGAKIKKLNENQLTKAIMAQTAARENAMAQIEQATNSSKGAKHNSKVVRHNKRAGKKR